ncbi:MAG: NrdH-redoxin [Candidatus Yanofskybacteria bacterium RIFCSPLOWO2_02_FULL_45_10]|uniref:NrdH-redoxin n=2 Tax=Candidatus Yanofskyibacteriota TaxID=1752733 RepID=A0A1F8G258_9BACT|nr:MAG: NrdH-redoxin [Candidatus Yanofskybacteria bacterium RIFCSPHIGHO2_12_FULL_45_19b]OGN32103.1 MAG: NrdH-redoxin [Candidatus Yanofskybacteria bacterium RIFCSPLOWO2_02_FULL_45_10]
MNVTHKIEIFTTPTCAYCKLAKEYFKSLNLPYEEYNVFLDEKRRNEMIGLTGQMGVPVLRINGQVVLGFNKMLINKALGI